MATEITRRRDLTECAVTECLQLEDFADLPIVRAWEQEDSSVEVWRSSRYVQSFGSPVLNSLAEASAQAYQAPGRAG